MSSLFASPAAAVTAAALIAQCVPLALDSVAALAFTSGVGPEDHA